MATQIKLITKDWKSFRHYGKRSTPWIKVPRSLLEDRVMGSMGIPARLVAYCLWLVASEHPRGLIDLPLEVVCHRVKLSPEELLEGLIPLVEAGYFSVPPEAEQ